MSNSKIGVASLVCGIVGIVGIFIPILNFFTIVPSILAIIFSRKAKKDIIQSQGVVLSGFILGIVGVVVNVICFAVLLIGLLVAINVGLY